MDLLVTLEIQVLLVRWDMPALRVLKDRKEAKATMGSRGNRVSGVVRAQLAPEGSQDLQALDSKATEVLLEILEFLGLWDLPARWDRKAQLDLLGFLGHQVNLVLRVSVASQAYQDLKVTEGLLVLRELKVNLVTRVSEVCKVRLVYRVCKDWLERKDPKGRWDCLDKMVRKDQEVTKDLLGLLDSGVLLGLPVMLDLQEDLGFKDHQEYQGTQDNLELKVTLVKLEESSMQLVPHLLASQDHLGPLALPALQDLLDCQVPLALLVCLANLVLKVTEDLRENKERQEYL